MASGRSEGNFRRRAGGSALVGQAEIPFEDDVLTLRVTDDPLTVATELRVVRGQELEPGERPLPLKIAAITAVVLAIANVAFYAAGVEVQGKPPQLTGVLAFAADTSDGLWPSRQVNDRERTRAALRAPVVIDEGVEGRVSRFQGRPVDQTPRSSIRRIGF